MGRVCGWHHGSDAQSVLGGKTPPALHLSLLAVKVALGTDWGQAGAAGPTKEAVLSLHLDPSFKSRFHHLPP